MPPVVSEEICFFVILVNQPFNAWHVMHLSQGFTHDCVSSSHIRLLSQIWIIDLGGGKMWIRKWGSYVHMHAMCHTASGLYATIQNGLCQISQYLWTWAISLSHKHSAAFLCLITTLPQWQSSHMWHFCLCVCVRVFTCVCGTSSIRNCQLVPTWQRCLEVLCVFVCVVSPRWPLITPTCRKWHMSTTEPRVMSNLTFPCHMTYTLTSWTAHNEFVVSSSLSELREHNKRAGTERISICIRSLYLLIHDSTASLLNAGSSKEISLPED